MVLFQCRICGNNKDNVEYLLNEMMFGYRDEFKYIKCASCGCLQIKEFPVDLKKYYPSNYYSFNNNDSILKKYLIRKRNQCSFGHKSIIGNLLLKRFGHSHLYNWLKEAGLNFDDKILEVGCGEGNLLKKIADLGFNNLIGVDPFISADHIYMNKAKVLKKYLENLDDVEFDFIMLHHSLEHMEHQVETLTKLNQLLKRGKFLLIRIPVVDTVAWEEYNTNWVQLDAPRHFYLHSVKSMEWLAKKTGFKTAKIIFDSNSFQFWGSEQYKRNIPLYSENSYYVNQSKVLFNSAIIKKYEDRAKMLNSTGQGDQAAFYLQKI
jgi:SAM-dependent methyltransferase